MLRPGLIFCVLVAQFYSNLHVGGNATIWPIRSEQDASRPQTLLPIQTSPRHKNKDPDACLAAAVASKIEEGNLKTAIRLLSSNEAIAQCDIDSAERLRSKHPSAPSETQALPHPDDFEPLLVTVDVVYDAIRSFPAGSSGVLMVSALNIWSTSCAANW